RNLGYVVSNRPGGRGNEDLYKVTRAADNVVILVKNASDGSPVAGATIDFSACGEGAFQTDAKGAYNLQIVQGLTCNLLIQKEGYLSKSLQISASGARETKEFQVMLSRIGEEYLGRVVNYSTNLPLEGVTINAVNQNTGSTMETVSDFNGDYLLALAPSTVYIVRYSRPGFRDLSRTVRADAGYSRDVLGIISMVDVNLAGPGQVQPPITNPNTPGNTTPDNTNPTVTSGFSVQVAAGKQANLSQYTALQNFGELYVKQEKGLEKVRIGPFANRQDADRVLGLVKNQGYKGAFIVKEEGVIQNPAGGGDALANKGGTETQPVVNGRYRIQLAAYRNPQFFKPDKIQDLGTIEDERRGDFTVKFLAAYDTLERARAILSQVKSAGFKDAIIVENIGGEWKKVQ
ncbi:MAG: carboxypeptidase regulatory-like domain-containing protein, partial [Saprospiraceae bacterium]